MTTETNELEHGAQPIDALMTERGMNNHALVEVAKSQLTHKAVRKARNGRQLTVRLQKKIVEAYNATLDAEATALTLDELFNYRGK